MWVKGLVSGIKFRGVRNTRQYPRGNHNLRSPYAHQGDVHELAETVLIEFPRADRWERPYQTAAELLREESTANRKFLDFIFDSYRKYIQADL